MARVLALDWSLITDDQLDLVDNNVHIFDLNEDCVKVDDGTKRSCPLICAMPCFSLHLGDLKQIGI